MLKSSLLAMASLALAGCGGGGGDETIPPEAIPLTFNADAALSNLFSAGAAFNGLAATDSTGNRYTLTMKFSMGTDAAFFGTTQKRSTQTLSVNRNGAFLASSSSNIFYSIAPSKLLAAVAADGLFRTYKPAGELPIAGRVGSSGAFNTFPIYASTTNNAQVGNGSTSWSIEADGPTTSFSCLKTTSTAGDNQNLCLKINSVGAIQGGRISIPINGQILTFL